MVGAVTVEDELCVVEDTHLSPFVDMDGVVGGSYGGIGYMDEIDTLAGEVAEVVFIGAQQRVVGQLVTLWIGADEAYTRHIATLVETLADVHAVKALGGATGGVGEFELLAVHVPGEVVGIGVVLHQLEVGLRGAVLAQHFGSAGVIVDAGAYVRGREGEGFEVCAHQLEGAYFSIHLA